MKQLPKFLVGKYAASLLVGPEGLTYNLKSKKSTGEITIKFAVRSELEGDGVVLANASFLLFW